ncbi:MAG: OPT family oligopeptide transporter, partial [Steroidobacteraceae bacterium]
MSAIPNTKEPGHEILAGADALPEDPTQEQRDRHWYTHVYQGDQMPQLTFRAVAMGAVLGMLMSVSNLYTVLKLGWTFGVAITSCVLSYLIWNGLRSISRGRLSPMSILENNCMQATASSAGVATVGTVGAMFGGLLILDPLHRHYPWYVIGAFSLTTGALGVLLAVPMKRQMINREQLPFPSGTAAATTLRGLHEHGGEAARKARALVISLFIGAVVGILNTAADQFVMLGRFFSWMRQRLFNIHLPDLIPAQGFGLLDGKPMVAFGFEPSALLIAAGMMVGLRVSLSIFGSSAALYFFIAPWLQSLDAANAGVAGYISSIPLVGGGTLFHPVRWALWGGSSTMVFAGLTALAFEWRIIGRAFQSLRRRPGPAADTNDIEQRMAAIEIPNRWLLIGLVPIALALMALQVIAFNIHWWAGLIAVGMSFVLAIVACRAVGETDTNPLGAMGKVMQLVFAVISPGNATHNLVSAGIGANAASGSADLLQDLKSGYLLGANPRRQFLAQMIGVFFGAIAIVPAWYLMIPNVAALEKYPLPATQVWVAVARILSAGIDNLPMSARIAILAGALIGTGITVLERLFPKARPWLPSPIGLGLGWVVFFSNALSFAIGALLARLWMRVHRVSHEALL